MNKMKEFIKNVSALSEEKYYTLLLISVHKKVLEL